MIKQQIQDQMKEAMRSHDKVKLETLRYVLSQIKYREIEKRDTLTDEEEIEVLTREVKKRRDAIELFRKSGREVLVVEEEVKLTVITALLPAQMSAEEIQKIVTAAVAKVGKNNMGLVMKEIMSQVKGKADGKLVSGLVKRSLSN